MFVLGSLGYTTHFFMAWHWNVCSFGAKPQKLCYHSKSWTLSPKPSKLDLPIIPYDLPSWKMITYPFCFFFHVWVDDFPPLPAPSGCWWFSLQRDLRGSGHHRRDCLAFGVAVFFFLNHIPKPNKKATSRKMLLQFFSWKYMHIHFWVHSPKLR